MDKALTQSLLAELLGVSIDALKKWRSSRFADKPLRLVPDGTHKRQSTYSIPLVLEWLERNPSYADRVRALTTRPLPTAAAWWASHGEAA